MIQVSFDPSFRRAFKKRVKGTSEDVHPLYGCESGSRTWGYSSVL